MAREERVQKLRDQRAGRKPRKNARPIEGARCCARSPKECCRDVVSDGTIRYLHRLLRTALQDAVTEDELLTENVAPSFTPRPESAGNSLAAEALLEAAERSPMRAYIVVSMLTGARTEELRALTWDRLDLDGNPNAEPPVPPSIQVWRSVREDGDTKTRKSRRTLELPQRCVQALKDHKERQEVRRRATGARWQNLNLVFASEVGSQLDAANVRRAFRKVAKAAGLPADEWTPRELRHSFVSLLSSQGVPIEDIAWLVGHISTTVTEKVYRHELRPVLRTGATKMDEIVPNGRSHTA